MNNTLTIATRQSPMAMWQAEHIQQLLQKQHPNLTVELLPMTTKGDIEQNTSLVDIGSKALFVKELQKALLEERADIAVHCIKDMSAQDCPGLTLAAVCKRDDPRDALVSNHYDSLASLPDKAVVGTASPRRQCLLKQIRPDIKTKLLRGNVNTRLKKLDDGEYDAIMLAAAGLKRLGFESRIREYFDPNTFIPAIAQGSLGIECRKDDGASQQYIAFLNDSNNALVTGAERTVNRYLGGDCHTPLGVYATLQQQTLCIIAMVGNSDGTTVIESHVQGNAANLEQLAKQCANELFAKGAEDLLKKP